MVDVTLTVTYFAILLGLGIIVADILNRHKIPDIFFLLMVGLLMGPTVYLNPAITQYVSITLVDVSVMGAIPDFLRILALIMIVFTSTFSLGFKMFKKFSGISISAAIIIVIFNTVVLGFLANMIFGINLTYGFLIGAVISGTSTEVLIKFEGSLKKMEKSYNILKIESILNSPMSVLMPLLFLDLIYLQPGAVMEPMKYLSQFWMMIIVGIGTGIVMGLAISKLLIRSIKDNYTILMLFAMALITYALSENMGGSGMLAVAVCGLIVGDLAFPGKKAVQRFDDQFSEMLRIAVFTLLGAQVALFMTMEQFIMVFIFFTFVVLIRPFILALILAKSRGEITRTDFILMSFVAPRGLSAAAMAPIVAITLLSIGEPELLANQIINIIFMVIVLSVLFSTIVGKVIARMVDRGERKTQKQTNMEYTLKKEDDGKAHGKEVVKQEEVKSTDNVEIEKQTMKETRGGKETAVVEKNVEDNTITVPEEKPEKKRKKKSS